MTEIKIILPSVNDVKTFVASISTCDCDLDIVAGRYIIDAKSIMGIFSLDLSKPLMLRINSSDKDVLSEVMGKISQFIINN